MNIKLPLGILLGLFWLETPQAILFENIELDIAAGIFANYAGKASSSNSIRDIRGAESGTRILLLGASYTTPETPPQGALQGVRVIHPADGKPFVALHDVLPQDRIFGILRPAIMKARNTWAGSFVEPTILGQLGSFRDWEGVWEQWEDIVSQNHFPSPIGVAPGAILLGEGDVLLLGPFNDCIHTLSGTQPLCFDEHVPNEHLNNFFLRLDEIVIEAVKAGLTVYIPGYPAFRNADPDLAQQILLPPETEVINNRDYTLLVTAYEKHFSGRKNVVFIPTDDIIVPHIGDGVHLGREYFEKVAQRIAEHFAKIRGYTPEEILEAERRAGHCYYTGNLCD